jgi:hypothetical protein
MKIWGWAVGINFNKNPANSLKVVEKIFEYFPKQLKSQPTFQ